MLKWWNSLFRKGPADATRSLAGCLLANLVGAAIVAAIAWLLGASFIAPGGK